MFRLLTSSAAPQRAAVWGTARARRYSCCTVRCAAAAKEGPSVLRYVKSGPRWGWCGEAARTSVRWQSTKTPTGDGAKRRRSPGRRGRRSSAEDSPVARAEAAAAVEAAAAAAVAQQAFADTTLPTPFPPLSPATTTPATVDTTDATPLAAQLASLIEPPVAAKCQSIGDANAQPTAAVAKVEEHDVLEEAATTAPRSITEAVMQEAPSVKDATADAVISAPPPPVATAAVPVAEARKRKADLLQDDLDQESFFSALLHPSGEGAALGGRAVELRESTLVYNTLTGRMTSENSLTMQCLREVGFSINDQRQLVLEKPTVLNALAARVRAGTAALPAKWPVTLIRAIGAVMKNASISDPAQALRQMMQVKINSVMRSRYASVVSAVGSEVDAAMAGETRDQHGLLNGGALDQDEAIELNEEQKRVIEIAMQGHHLFIGGSAGTGKTVLLRALARRLQGHRLRVAMTATTGVAGCHIGGSTFHHALGVTSRGEFLRRNMILDYDVIIIDEVSMFPQRLFEEFDRVLREEAGAPDLPFGGVQIILCGDFLQLGCINERSLVGSSLFQKNFVKVRLETQVRQIASSKFANDLQLMRLGIVPTDLKSTVQQLPPGTMVDSAVNLLPTNKEVHVANERELQRLPGDPLTLTPETGITSLQCETTATLLLRTTPDFNEAEFARHVRSLLQATLDLPRASLLSLYRVYEDGHAMRVMLPAGESVAWRDAMRERFLELAGLLNDLELGATVREIVPNGDGLHTPETEEYLNKVMSKHPIAQPLTLKKGCRVLLRANLSSNLVNGSIGTVVDFVECKEDSFPDYLKTDSVKRSIDRYRVFCFTECGMPLPMVPVVQFYTGEKIAVPPWEFTVGGGPNTHFYSLSSVALPLSLAYAFTVHKVQGLTLVGRVHLELSRMWPCEHLLYVAMSRVRNPEQLSMSSFSSSMVLANETSVHFDKSLRGALQWTDAEVTKFPVSAWRRCNDTIYHLRRRGASLRGLLEGVTSMHSAATPLSMKGRALQPEHDDRSGYAGLPSLDTTADGGSGGFQMRAGGPGALDGGAAKDGDGDVLSMEYLGSLQQSVLVARRMRKLVKHVERVAKLTNARRRTKQANGTSTSRDEAASLVVGVAARAPTDGANGGDASHELEHKEGKNPHDGTHAASVVAVSVAAAAAVRAAARPPSLVIEEEHSF